jgi:DnaJ-class molecular chaperone
MGERGPEYEPREKTCPQCGGSGRMRDSKGGETKCDRCNGKGFIIT